jgi:hypothetical protein
MFQPTSTRCERCALEFHEQCRGCAQCCCTASAQHQQRATLQAKGAAERDK